MSYLLDTNIFIRCKNDMPLDIFQSFWLKIAELAQEGRIYSSVKVKEEIERGNDDLKEWCKEKLPSSFFLPLDDNANVAYAKLMNWANECNYTPAAKQEFAMVADAFIVATAASKGMKVVTFETSHPNRITKVQIPEACKALNVDYCSLLDVFHELEVTI